MQVESTIAAAVRLYSTSRAYSGVLTAYARMDNVSERLRYAGIGTLASIQTSSSRQLRKTRSPMTLEPAGDTSRFSFGYAAGTGKPMRCFKPPAPPSGEVSTSSRDTSEPHERPATAHLAQGLENVPCKLIEHNGIALSEFDLDAAIERAPQLILVDELAHTNAPGVSPRQTLSRRRGTSTCGHRRLYDRERSAYREPKRHGCIHHRRCRERTNPPTVSSMMPTRSSSST